MSDIGRALVAMRRTVTATCALDGCEVEIVARVRDRATGELERRFCTPAHRAKAYYRANKEARLEYQRQRRANRRPAAPPQEAEG